MVEMGIFIVLKLIFFAKCLNTATACIARSNISAMQKQVTFLFFILKKIIIKIWS